MSETAKKGMLASLGSLQLAIIFDFAIGFGLLWDRFPVPGLGQPAGILLVALAVIVAGFRKPVYRITATVPIVALYATMLFAAVLVSQLAGLGWQQRAAKLVILLLFALCVAAGRIQVKPLLLGLSCAMVMNVVLFYLRLTPNLYPPYLTGFLGDKNVAGLAYATVAILGLILYPSTRLRWAHLAGFALFVYLTGSRTSMAALLVGVIWVWVRNRTVLLVRLTLVGLVVWLLVLLETTFSQLGIFTDRAGTDWFREQIDLATAKKLLTAPWFGEGLTTAWVRLDGGRIMFFHDSYAALRIEGGWPMLILMLVLVLWFGAGLLRNAPVPTPLAVAEGAIAVVLVCAWKLGEVFFTTQAFLVLGIAWGLRYGVSILGAQAVATAIPRRAELDTDCIKLVGLGK